MILTMPEIAGGGSVQNAAKGVSPPLRPEYVRQFTALFLDIRDKCRSGELTEKVLDLRGLLGAVRMMAGGLAPIDALNMGITNKTPDTYEQSLVQDIISSRISGKTDRDRLFGNGFRQKDTAG